MVILIGGCAFSMAGGIRVSRIVAFASSAKEAVQGIFAKETPTSRLRRNGANGNGNSSISLDGLSASVSILLFLGVLIVFSLIFTTTGVSFTNAIFEVGSALTTNGVSMGATNIMMGIGYKWLIIVAMTIGRVEMLSILLAIFALIKR